jgi:hypothetical protein
MQQSFGNADFQFGSDELYGFRRVQTHSGKLRFADYLPPEGSVDK